MVSGLSTDPAAVPVTTDPIAVRASDRAVAPGATGPAVAPGATTDPAVVPGATDPGAAVAAVVDPELRVVTIAELGILRDVSVAGGHVTVTITPTYSGCPAMDVIRADIRRALAGAGWTRATVRTELRPAWTTDLISEAGRRKLAAAGIAPPERVADRAPDGRGGSTPVPLTLSVRCPRCGSHRTEEIARFGATACKALWRCRDCAEPFERMKPL